MYIIFERNFGIVFVITYFNCIFIISLLYYSCHEYNEELLIYLKINSVLHVTVETREYTTVHTAEPYCPFNLRSKKSIFWKYLYLSPIARLFLLFTLEYEMRYMRWPNLIFHTRRGCNVKIMERIKINFCKILEARQADEVNFFSPVYRHRMTYSLR